MRELGDWLRNPMGSRDWVMDELGIGFRQFSLYNGLPEAGFGGRGVEGMG